jgi:hypothetical protein
VGEREAPGRVPLVRERESRPEREGENETLTGY